jgi:23S rRNA (adenine2503-C2)-methyltransferase
MLKGVNDSLEDAANLCKLVANLPCKLNLIHFNAHEGTTFQASDEATVLQFQAFLKAKGMTVTVRESRGDEAMMACGQLGLFITLLIPQHSHNPHR